MNRDPSHESVSPADSTLLSDTVNSLTDQIGLFEMVQDLSQKIISQFDLNHILETFSDIIQEVAGFGTAAVYLFDKHRRPIQAFSSGENAGKMDLFLPEQKMIDWIMSQGRWTLLDDPGKEGQAQIGSILPIRTPKSSSGFMIMLAAPDRIMYRQKMISILSFVASQTAIAIENQDLYAQVESSRTYLANIVESISNGIMATDLAGNVTLINKNATALLGIRAQKIRGENYKTLLEPELAEEVEKIHSQIQADGFVPEAMVSHYPCKEVSISIGVGASLLTDPEQKIIGIIFIFRNMSASKEIQRLTRLDAMKNEFVSNVSHELRTPLSIIKSYSEALLNQVEPDDYETQKQFLQVIDSQTDSLTRIVGNLLDLSRAESGQMTLELSSVAFSELVDTVVTGFSKKLRDITLYVNLEKNLPRIEIDEEKIRQVLVNLVENAIKFSPDGGIINIEAIRKDEHIICSVSDTGIGIPEDQLSKIFQKFYRVDNSDTCAVEGTGLGLSIVKHIVQSHHGRIVAQSRKNRGSVFTFSLPFKKGGDGL